MMEFCEKLDFVMKVTNTSNSALSLYTSLDPSHISRLRRGQRNAAKNESYVRKMSSYFARNCGGEYQRKALLDALGLPQELTDSGELADHIYGWLNGGKNGELRSVRNFLGELTTSEFQKPPTGEVSENVETEPVTAGPRFYYGPEGKRRAALAFLAEAAAQQEPRTLLLFSDEATDWMTESRAYAAKWASLMIQVLAKGNRIKIIHTVSRDLDEMLNAILHWLPLYLSGLIEPFYYPKKRDGIFKRTLFIAPEVCAVVSSSVGVMIGGAANLYTRDVQAVSSYGQEFNHYLALCRPLMRIYTKIKRDAFLYALRNFEKEPGSGMICTESLSLLTMPDTVVESISHRIGAEQSEFPAYQRQRKDQFARNLRSHRFTEILCLPDPETVAAGKVTASISDMIGDGPVYYTAREYILHLENLISYLQMYPNFHVGFASSGGSERLLLYAREDRGVIIAKTAYPSTVFEIDEGNMTAAFWDYLRNLAEESVCDGSSNESAIRKLTTYLKSLKDRAE